MTVLAAPPAPEAHEGWSDMAPLLTILDDALRSFDERNRARLVTWWTRYFDATGDLPDLAAHRRQLTRGLRFPVEHSEITTRRLRLRGCGEPRTSQ